MNTVALEVFNGARAMSEMVYKYVDMASLELGRTKALDLLTEVCQALVPGF